MNCFIKKIFEGHTHEDSLVHVQFQRFSRGEFREKAMILYSKTKDRYSLSTTFEYANEFVRLMAEKLGSNKAKITGVVVSTRDLTGQINFTSKKQFAGVKQYVLDCEMTGKEILDLLNKFPTAFFALSFALTDESTEIKIKPKAPISGKPSTKSSEKGIKADFCKFYTTNRELTRYFVFDSEINENTKKAEIKHNFLINDIIIPQGEKDFAKMRELAKRKGKIIRFLKIDEKEIKKEAEFLA